jgi:hypothetical protein
MPVLLPPQQLMALMSRFLKYWPRLKEARLMFLKWRAWAPLQQLHSPFCSQHRASAACERTRALPRRRWY